LAAPLWQGDLVHTEDWPATVEEALATQERLRGRVDLTDDLPERPPTVTGLDVEGSTAASAVTPETEWAAARTRADCPDGLGSFAFRELPHVSTALIRVAGVLVAAGHRSARPRLTRRGGSLPGRPALGVAKPRSGGVLDEPGAHRSPVWPVDPNGKEPGFPSQRRPVCHAGGSIPHHRLSRAALR
jgi:deoxyribonuclease V